MPSACPSRDLLVQVIDGGAEPERAASIRAHIDSCEPCQLLAMELVISTDGVAADPTTSAYQPGEVVAGRYQVRGVIGAGGMGVVLDAWDTELRREVALKVLRPDGHHDARSVARLVRESRSLAKLRHPNVVTVYDVGVTDRGAFVAMERVDGSDLRRWVATHEVSTDDVRECLRQAAVGLAAAHECGLVHRDFKPDNVLVDADGRTLVTDFGLARPAEGEEAIPPRSHRHDAPAVAVRGRTQETSRATMTRSGERVGTPAYVAPEQYQGQATTASDVFSFCVTAVELLSGTRPFAASTAPAIQAAIAGGPPELSIRGVDRRLQRYLRAGLRHDPAERPSLVDLVEALTPRRSSRLPAVVMGAVGMAVVGGLAWSGGLLTGVEPEPESTRHERCEEPISFSGLREVLADPETPESVEHAIDAFIAGNRAFVDAQCERDTRDPVIRSDVGLRLLCAEYDRRIGGLQVESWQAGRRTDAELVGRLPTVTACDDPRLATIWPQAKDETRWATDLDLWTEAFRLSDLATDGGSPAVRDELRALADRIRSERASVAILAETLYALGTYLSFSGETEKAYDVLLEASRAAQQSYYDKIGVLTWSSLAMIAATERNELERADEFIANAKAALHRLGDHPIADEFSLATLQQEAIVRDLQQRDADAERLYREGIERSREADPSMEAHFVDGLGILVTNQGRLAEALDLAERALKLRLQRFGPDHAYVGYSRENVALSLVMLARYEEALPHFDDARRVFALHYGDASVHTVRIAAAKSDALVEVGRYDDAEAELAAAAAYLRDGVTSPELELVVAGSRLGLALARGERVAARQLADRYLALAKELDPDAEGPRWIARAYVVLTSDAKQDAAPMRAFAAEFSSAREALDLDPISLGIAGWAAGHALRMTDGPAVASRYVADVLADPRLRELPPRWVGRIRGEPAGEPR